MFTLLVINTSLAGGDSVSRALVEDAVAELSAAHGEVRVLRRDLALDPIPHLTAGTLAGVRGVPATPAELKTRALSDELIAELKAADAVVIGAPMYNFSVPTTLRSWFDHVLRAGETFSYSETGPKGLVAEKPVIVVESRGGFYSEGPAQAVDFQEPYLRQLLGFIGLTDVTFVRAEKIGFGPDARAEAIRGARAELKRAGERQVSLAA